MTTSDDKKPSLKGQLGAGRRSVSVSQESLIKSQPLLSDSALPLLVTPAVEGLNLITWANSHRPFIETNLAQHGGILFRNFNIKTLEEFQRFVSEMSNELLEYTYRSTPRSKVSGNIYTSTEYPADQSIPLHNEMSYTTSWPMKIWFCCLIAPQQQGETPIADSRRIYQRLDPAIRDRFAEKKVMYVRNYGEGIDLSWENVFQTDNKADVEEFCRLNQIDFEWKSGNRLRTRQVCQAVAKHPKTNEMVWFNQAHLFHVTSLPAAVRDMLLAEFNDEDLPRNTYYGDGSPIEPEVLAEIRHVLDQETVMFPWQEGDVLMLDNMLVAHARSPFVGPRKIVVGMAESVDAAAI
ncbi:MAG TPA: TauD/TfdA family dioxygenase [Herpetosiphon sp.]|uniref:Taurine catabolism dioxygenase TauD/TfdA n=1 Tax=Herpetosiphon aurantiacus (strain ATCC 23779 / DSM 785 / 114-95) TaxID=316274 RepID=A9AUJ2_HERA2|nr:TauD/TfdA family dioxygenase [Herpetosiphon sp.]ABX04519.1 Taurine catabolism dioxygenase TauD/TfdA [Herpetosiphon aurantiacus DSM 785]HBW49882.1 TauD/TfdA family dioxygenase [Herpetosiphon sp.]